MNRFKKIIFVFLVMAALVGVSAMLPNDKSKYVKKRIVVENSTKSDDKTKFSATEVVYIKILSYVKAKEIVFAPENGIYLVFADGKNLLTLDVQNALKISVVGDSLEVKSFEKNWGKFAS